MKKFIFCLCIAIFEINNVYAEYIRKTINPAFFMPVGAIKRTEKLPPFPGWEKVKADYLRQKAAAQAALDAQNNQDELLTEENTEQNSDEALTDNLLETNEINHLFPTQNDTPIDENFEKTQNYQEIRKSYAHDLKVIAKTGKAPENSNVNTTLEKMKDGKILWVDDSFGNKKPLNLN